MKRSLLLLGLVLAAGCMTGHYHDPNEPSDGLVTADSIFKRMNGLNNSLYYRRTHGEITEAEYKDLLVKGAAEYVQAARLKPGAPSELWKYAEVLIAAHMWPEAEQTLAKAVQNAKDTHNEDRRINDTLRMARAQAEQGKIKQAIATARETLNAKPADSVPVMMATLYEVIPAAKDKGEDLELARLLADAIEVNSKVVVDKNSEAGVAYLLARPRHIRHAWMTLEKLYLSANRPDLAKQAAEHMAKPEPVVRT